MAHHQDGQKWYVDTDFINKVQYAYPKAVLNHMGFGEFYLETPDGRLDFNRMAGKDFDGQSGRSHLLQDDKHGKVIKKAIKYMERARKSERLAALETRIAKLQSKVGALKNKRIFFDFRGDKLIMDFRADTGSHKAGAKWLLKAYEDFSKQVLKYSKLNLESMSRQDEYWAQASETALQGKPIELAIEAHNGTLGFLSTLMFTIDAAVIKRNFHIPAGQPTMWEPMKPARILKLLADWFEKSGWKVTIK